MAIMMIMSIKVFQDHCCTTGIWTRIFYCIFDEPKYINIFVAFVTNMRYDFCRTGDWTRINDSKTFFKFWVYFFYEPDGIGDMTKVMIMINLVLIMMVIMIMLIFLHAKVFQVALKVELLLLDLTHFTQI